MKKYPMYAKVCNKHRGVQKLLIGIMAIIFLPIMILTWVCGKLMIILDWANGLICKLIDKIFYAIYYKEFKQMAEDLNWSDEEETEENYF